MADDGGATPGPLFWQDTGDYGRAAAAYAEALRVDASLRSARYNLAVTQIRLGDYGAANTTLAPAPRRRSGSTAGS